MGKGNKGNPDQEGSSSISISSSAGSYAENSSGQGSPTAARYLAEEQSADGGLDSVERQEHELPPASRPRVRVQRRRLLQRRQP